nr:hypothetical protein [Tanacetum cinerariifolium]
MEQYLAHTDYALWEVILNGNSAAQMTKDEAGNEVEVPPITAQQILARTRERKAKITLLMAILDEHLARFHGIKDAKTLWAAVKTRFGGNADPQLNNEDLKQINQYDLEEMELKWQVAMLSMGVKRFYKKTGRKLEFNGKKRVGFDKIKSYQVEDEAIYFALMAFTSNPLSSSISNSELDEALKEIEDLKAKLKKFKTSLKNLTKLLDSQISAKVKIGLGYDSQFNEKEVLDVKEKEVTETVFDNRLSDEENSLANDRFKKGEGYHAVPPSLTGNYMPPKSDLSFPRLDDSIYTFKISEIVTSVTKDEKDAPETCTACIDKPKEDRSSALLIQDWDTDSDNDNVFSPEHILDKIYFVKTGETIKHVKPVKSIKPVKPIKPVQTSEHTKKSKNFSSNPKTDNRMAKKFVLPNNVGKGTGHKESIPVWNNVQRTNQQKNFAPTAVFTRFGRIPVSAVKPKVAASTTYSRWNSIERVNTARSKAVNVVKGNEIIVVKTSAEVKLPAKSSDYKAADDKPKGDIGSKTVEEPVNKEDQAYRDELDRLISQEKEVSDAANALRKGSEQGCMDQRGATNAGNTNPVDTISNPVNVASTSGTFTVGGPSSPHPNAFIPANTLLQFDQDDSQIPDLEDTAKFRSNGIFNSTYDDDLDIFTSPVQSVGAEADFNNIDSSTFIFRYLKGQPKLGLWYPRDSLFDLESYSDSDYAGANFDRKPTTGEYVAAANCCGQVLWILNQMLDYDFNFMNTKIFIDKESTICIVKNLVYHSKTKHVEIRHHFIRDSYEKKLTQVLKIHTDDNATDLLTKAFDVSRALVLLTPGDPIFLIQGWLLRPSIKRGDSLVRAATTASLDAQQDSSNITKTQSKATLNEPTPQGEGSGSGPGRQETMGGAMAHIRSECALIQSIDSPLSSGYTVRSGEDMMEHDIELMDPVAQTPHDSPLSGGHTHGSDEGSMTLKELTDLCTTLSQKVLDLKNVKTAQAKKIASLKKRINKLEQRQSSRFLGFHPFRAGASKRNSLVETVSTARPYASVTGPEVSTAEPKTPLTTINLFDDEDVTIVDTLTKKKDQDQIERDAKVVLKIQAHLNERERERQEEASKAALCEMYDEVQVQIDVNHELSVRLTLEEQEKYTVEERSKLLAEFFERRKKQLAKERTEAIRSKPPTKTQLKNLMMTYL